MALETIYDLNMDAGSVPFVINKSRGDTDVTLIFAPYSEKGTFTLGSGSSYSYYLEGTLPDGTKFRIGGNQPNIGNKRCIRFLLTEELTSIPGDVIMQVNITRHYNQAELRSSKIILRVEDRKPRFWGNPGRNNI